MSTTNLNPLMPGFGDICDVELRDGTVRRNSTWARRDGGGHFIDADGTPIPPDQVLHWHNERLNQGD